MVSRWFTFEDAKTSFSLFCCVYGIGTLGMPANFARAGPMSATLALIFMAIANIYASLALSYVFLVAPSNVKTYSDIGEWAMGKSGKVIALTSQISVCLLIPCAFLVLGGDLLQVIATSDFSRSFWIIIMAIFVLPVCLVPTLKEGSGMAFIGCLATLFSDAIALGVLTYEMSGHPIPVPSPDVVIHQVLTTFGNLSLAYGAGNIIPDLQRQHSQPEHMPRVIFVTLALISVLFFTLASTGYSSAGCQMSGNLLFTIAGVEEGEAIETTGKSLLGFTANSTAVFLAFFCMQIHITIAFSVILHPAFYIFERIFLQMHRSELSLDEKVKAKQIMRGTLTKEFHQVSLDEIVQNTEDGVETTIESKDDIEIQELNLQDVESSSNIDSSDSLEANTISDVEGEALEYTGKRTIAAYVLLRLVVVVLLVIISLALQDHFFELSDFIGASAISLSCLILPLVWYLQVFWTDLRWIERICAIIIIFICSIVGLYVAFTTGESLFQPHINNSMSSNIFDDNDSVIFKFCTAEYQHESYFIPED